MKLKKIFLKNLFGFVIGLLVFGGVVYATVLIQGDSVTYSNSKSGLNSTKVKGAIDELYNISKTNCPEGYKCELFRYYAFGEPTTSSTKDYTTLGKKVFVSLQGEQKSVCIIIDGDLECFKNNNWNVEKNHITDVFGASKCTISDTYVYCYNGDFSANIYSAGFVDINDNSTYKRCYVDEKNIATCKG